MACALAGELKCKDGRTNRFKVEAENNLRSIIGGVKKLSAEISVVLTELVEEEKSAGSGERVRMRDEEVEEDDEDVDGDENGDDAPTETCADKLKSEPPAKRPKSITPT